MAIGEGTGQTVTKATIEGPTKFGWRGGSPDEKLARRLLPVVTSAQRSLRAGVFRSPAGIGSLWDCSTDSGTTDQLFRLGRERQKWCFTQPPPRQPVAQSFSPEARESWRPVAPTFFCAWLTASSHRASAWQFPRCRRITPAAFPALFGPARRTRLTSEQSSISCDSARTSPYGWSAPVAAHFQPPV